MPIYEASERRNKMKVDKFNCPNWIKELRKKWGFCPECGENLRNHIVAWRHKDKMGERNASTNYRT